MYLSYFSQIYYSSTWPLCNTPISLPAVLVALGLISRPFDRNANGRTDGRARSVEDTENTEDAATLRVPQNHDPHWYAIER